mmetsp:Transcript_10856/g.21607  ORF Transcript_10856/g.21607 Transcript_10856/m.21607 type:complete len:171 (-) Transcript_10856:1529-2041(-)
MSLHLKRMHPIPSPSKFPSMITDRVLKIFFNQVAKGNQLLQEDNKVACKNTSRSQSLIHLGFSPILRLLPKRLHRTTWPRCAVKFQILYINVYVHCVLSINTLGFAYAGVHGVQICQLSNSRDTFAVFDSTLQKHFVFEMESSQKGRQAIRVCDDCHFSEASRNNEKDMK